MSESIPLPPFVGPLEGPCSYCGQIVAAALLADVELCPECAPILTIPMPPTLRDVERTQLEADMVTRENAARVRAQSIALYAHQVCEAWPAVADMIRGLERIGAPDYQERVRAMTGALVTYTAAVARLNVALES